MIHRLPLQESRRDVGNGVGGGVGVGIDDVGGGAAIAGEGATIDLTRGNIEPTANPPTNVAVLIIFRRETQGYFILIERLI